MKASIFTLALTALLFGSALNTNAQENNDRESRRAEMRTKQMERVVKNLKLSDEQRTKFEPIYTSYQDELFALMAPKGKMDGGKKADAKKKGKDKKDKEELTDAEAAERLQQVFDRQAEEIQKSQQRLDIQKKYCAQFSSFLTPQQLLRLFQPRGQQRNGRQQGRSAQNGRGGRGGRGGNQGMGTGPRGGFGGGPQGNI